MSSQPQMLNISGLNPILTIISIIIFLNLIINFYMPITSIPSFITNHPPPPPACLSSVGPI